MIDSMGNEIPSAFIGRERTVNVAYYQVNDCCNYLCVSILLCNRLLTVFERNL